jgi:hypothetical protein
VSILPTGTHLHDAGDFSASTEIAGLLTLAHGNIEIDRIGTHMF